MGINKSTTKKLEYHKVFWPGNIKSTGTVIRQFRVGNEIGRVILVEVWAYLAEKGPAKIRGYLDLS